MAAHRRVADPLVLLGLFLPRNGSGSDLLQLHHVELVGVDLDQ